MKLAKYSSKLWSSQLRTQFKQLRIEAWKSQDFNGVWTHDLAIPVRHSNQLSYEATDVGSWSFVSSNEPVKKWVWSDTTAMIIAYLISIPQFNVWNISYITSQAKYCWSCFVHHSTLWSLFRTFNSSSFQPSIWGLMSLINNNQEHKSWLTRSVFSLSFSSAGKEQFPTSIF